MGRWGTVIVAALALFGARPANAVLQATDVVPAATILFPYFEVDVGDANGVTTLLALQNASASASMARWTLWTDLGLPTHSFDTYLTGFDTQTVNLRDVFVQGNLPVTADDGDDPQDTGSPDTGVSNQGPFSQDINFPCGNGMPLDVMPWTNPVLTGPRFTDLQAAHRGLEAPFYFGAGKCGGVNHGDQIVRGYVTVDTVTQCIGIGSPVNPTNAGYFSGVASTQNVLLGDWFLVDPANDRMEADTAVQIEVNIAQNTPAGTYTFYGGLVSGNASDHREALATTWAASFESGRSDLIVWRDRGTTTAAFNCGATPFPFPLPHRQVVAFDMESTGTPVVGEAFPFRTGVRRIGTDVEFGGGRGWAYMNLNAPIGGFFPVKQSWVTVRRRLESGDVMSAAASAVPLGRAVTNDDVLLIPNP